MFELRDVKNEDLFQIHEISESHDGNTFIRSLRLFSSFTAENWYNNGDYSTLINDKRDGFSFVIINFPHLSFAWKKFMGKFKDLLL